MEDMNPELRPQYEARLRELEIEHRDLDAAIHRLSDDPLHNPLALRRMKKRKLLLKDQITWISRQMDPDIMA
jgi:hypothetical protein